MSLSNYPSPASWGGRAPVKLASKLYLGVITLETTELYKTAEPVHVAAVVRLPLRLLS